MNRRVALFLELPVALAGIALGVWCWTLGVVETSFGPAIDGAPATQGTRYVGSWIALAFLLLAVAVVAVMDAVRRLRESPDQTVPESGTPA